jgi:hypothetical protein
MRETDQRVAPPLELPPVDGLPPMDEDPPDEPPLPPERLSLPDEPFWSDDEPVGAREVVPVVSGFEPERWAPDAALFDELLEELEAAFVDERDSVDWRMLLRSLETPVRVVVPPRTDTPTLPLWTRVRLRTATLGSS